MHDGPNQFTLFSSPAFETEAKIGHVALESHYFAGPGKTIVLKTELLLDDILWILFDLMYE